MSAHGLLAPALGDRVNAVYINHLWDGVDAGAKNHALHFPLIEPGRTNTGTGDRATFKAPAAARVVGVVFQWAGGLSTSGWNVEIVHGGVSTVFSQSTSVGASGRDSWNTDFSLVADGDYAIRLNASGATTRDARSVAVTLVVQFDLIAKPTLTNDVTPLSAASLNDLEENVRRAGSFRMMVFGLHRAHLGSGNDATKARFEFPALPNAGVGCVLKITGVTIFMGDAVSTAGGTANYRLRKPDGSITHSLNFTYPLATGDHYVHDMTEVAVESGEWTITKDEDNATASQESAIFVIYLKVEYTKQTWADKDLISATGKLAQLDKAIQNMTDVRPCVVTYMQLGQVQPVFNVTRLKYQSNFPAVKFSAKGTNASATNDAFGASTRIDDVSTSDIPLNTSFPANATSTIYVGTPDEALYENPDSFWGVAFQNGTSGTTTTVHYAHVVFGLSSGLDSPTKDTTIPSDAQVPVVGSTLNKFNVGTFAAVEAIALSEPTREIHTGRTVSRDTLTLSVTRRELQVYHAPRGGLELLLTNAGRALHLDRTIAPETLPFTLSGLARHAHHAGSEQLTLADAAARRDVAALLELALISLLESVTRHTTPAAPLEALTLTDAAARRDAAKTLAHEIALALAGRRFEVNRPRSETIPLSQAVRRDLDRAPTLESVPLLDTTTRHGDRFLQEEILLALERLLRDRAFTLARETLLLFDADTLHETLALQDEIRLDDARRPFEISHLLEAGLTLSDSARRDLVHVLAEEACALVVSRIQHSMKLLTLQELTLSQPAPPRLEIGRRVLEALSLVDPAARRDVAAHIEEAIQLSSAGSYILNTTRTPLVYQRIRDLLFWRNTWPAHLAPLLQDIAENVYIQEGDL